MVWMDFVLAGILLLSLGIGARRGLLDSLGNIASMVLAFLVAGWAADALSGPVAEWLRPMLAQKVQQSLAPSELEEAMVSASGYFGPAAGKLAEKISQAVQQTGKSLADAVADGIIHSVAYAILYLVAFVVVLFLLRLLLRPLDLAARLPGLHLLNTVGGGVLGLLTGVLALFFAVWVLENFHWIITEEMVQRSTLLKIFVNNSPMTWLTSL